jgi:twinkle protein
MDWLGQHITFLMPDEEAPSIAHLLDLAKIQVYRHGIKGLILDPWNEIEHNRPAGLSETEYISQVLSQIRRFARNHGVHIWIIAHPTKLRKAETGEYAGQYPPPTPYDISGSAHFRNKADNCITIWRNVELNNNRVEVHIQKIRFREIGKPGMVELIYEPSCGRFHEPVEETEAWSA